MSAVKKQKGLGRGLDALLGDAPKARRVESEDAGKAEGAARPKSTLPIEFLKPNPNQPRRDFDEAAIMELVLSIKSKGLLQPIIVRPAGPNSYEIVAGERRWRAAQKAKLHDVPVIIRELTDEETAEIALIENVQRVDLNPVEEARAYQRLADVHKRTQEDIGRAVGKSRSHVANTLRLLSLPEAALAALARGEITAGHARAILSAPEPEKLLKAVLANGLSVRDTEKLAETARNEKAGVKPAGGKTVSEAKQASPAKKDADTRALEADLAAALGLEVVIEHRPAGSGMIAVRYLTLDQLDDVCRRLMGTAV
jgi:ParB family chromosome partitioning protein